MSKPTKIQCESVIITAYSLFFSFHSSVDAVYVMAHAIHQNLKERCGDKEFVKCENWKPAPTGVDLLRLIREMSFIGMQGNQVSN